MNRLLNLPQVATFIAIVVCSAAAAAADSALRYRLSQGQVVGYTAVLEVRHGGRTEYYVGSPLLAIAGQASGEVTAVMALKVEKVKSQRALPSQPAEFHTETIDLQGGGYSLNEEQRSFKYLPGSIVDQIFPRLPARSDQQEWGGREPFISFGSSDRGHQESRYELLDSGRRIRETFVRHVENDKKVPKEEWRGTGESEFDPKQGLLTNREFSLVYSNPPGDPKSEIHSKLTLRLLDGGALVDAAQRTAVRLPGHPELGQEKAAIRQVGGSGRWAHTDTKFYDTQKLLASRDGQFYQAHVVGRPQAGLVCFRLAGSRAFWDGYLPPGKFQFIPGESLGSVAVIQAAERSKLLADLQGGEMGRVTKAIKQLANLRPAQPDDEMAAALVTWIGVTEPHHANDFSEAMEHWATPASAPELVKALRMTDGWSRRVAEAGLTSIGAPAESEVARNLQHPKSETREWLVRVLGRIGTGKSVAALDSIAQQDKDKKVRGAARSAAYEIRQRHGLPSPMSVEEPRIRANVNSKPRPSITSTGPSRADPRRRMEDSRRKLESQRKKFDTDMKARRSAS